MPELPNRTSSTDGTAATIFAAASASSSYGSANIVPISWMARVTRSVIAGWAWPWIIGPRASR